MNQKISLTKGNPFRVLLLFSIPMILSVTLQQFYNICDSLIAGKCIGDYALAAVSASYPITMIYLAIGTGFGVGANIICARYIGQKDVCHAKETVFTSLLTIGIAAMVIGAVGYLVTPALIRLIQVEDAYYSDAVVYLNYYTIGMLFLFIYNCVTSLFQALGNSKIPLYFLIFSTLLNIALDLFFVLRLAMGVEGIALATFLAQGIASLCSLGVLLVYVRRYLPGRVKLFNFRILGKILPIAIPSILQASIISLGQVFIQALINSYGADVVAGYGAAYKICYVIVNIYTTMSNAISTFTSQNAGAGEYLRIRRGFQAGLIICGVLTVIATVLFLCIPKPLLSIFGNENTSDEVVRVGCRFIFCVAPFYFLLCIKIPCDGVLKGSRDMIGFMISTLADLIVRVMLSYALAPKMGITGIFIAWPIGWGVGMGLSVGFYLHGRWRRLIGFPDKQYQ